MQYYNNMHRIVHKTPKDQEKLLRNLKMYFIETDSLCKRSYLMIPDADKSKTEGTIEFFLKL